jgi:hypothetical protein
MSVWGITMMRDEEDVAEHVIRHMFGEGLAGIIVADNNSKDGTLAALHRASRYGNLIVQDDPEMGYYQSKKMTTLAHQAAGNGATWIVPFDADELWYAVDRLSITLMNMPEEVRVVRAPLWNHFPSAIDPEGKTPFQRIAYRQLESGALPKVCFRYHESCWILQGNHGVTMEDTRWPEDSVQGDVKLRHFPYRSFEQFMRKATNGAEAYRATDLPPEEGAHWRQYGEILERHGEAALRDVFEKWFHFPAPVTAGLVLDPAPYCRWE